MAKLNIQRPPPRGFAALKCDFSTDFNAWMKQFPGVHWGGDVYQKRWLIPQELHECVRDQALLRGLNPKLVSGTPGVMSLPSFVSAAPLSMNPALYPPQQSATLRVLRQRSLLLSSEPGCGKTAVAIEVARLSNAKRVLVVCPAGVRRHWEREVKKWWEDFDGDVTLIQTAPDWATLGELTTLYLDGTHQSPTAPCVIVVSYELLPHAPTEPWDMVVLDEANAVKTYSTARAKAAKSILRANPSAIHLALTGTPIDVSPADLFNVLDLLRPKGFGWFKSFRSRYLDVEYSEQGFPKVLGTNPEHAEELRQRLEFVSLRTTKAEIAPFLPKLTVVPRYVSGVAGGLLGRHANESTFRSVAIANLQQTAGARLDAVLAWTQELNDAQAEGPRLIVTYHRQLAESVCRLLGAGQGQYVDGTVSQSERELRISRCLRNNLPLIATMKSIGVGRDDLVDFQHVLVAEIYPVPSALVQLLGRWGRLSSTQPTKVDLLTVEGTIDEVSVDRCLERVGDIVGLFKPGSGEEQIESALRKEVGADALRAMFAEVDE